MFRRPARLTPLGLNRRMRENRLSGGVGGVTGNSRHPDPISRQESLRYGEGPTVPKDRVVGLAAFGGLVLGLDNRTEKAIF